MEELTYKTFDPRKYNSIRQLCQLYRVNHRTMKEWIKPILEVRNRRFPQNRYKKFEYVEIMSIIEYLGLPFAHKEEKELKDFDFYDCNTILSLANFYHIEHRAFKKSLELLTPEILKEYKRRRKFFPREVRIILHRKVYLPNGKDLKNDFPGHNIRDVSDCIKF